MLKMITIVARCRWIAALALPLWLLACGGGGSDSNGGGDGGEGGNVVPPMLTQPLEFKSDTLDDGDDSSAGTGHDVLRARYLDAAEVVIYRKPNPGTGDINKALLVIPGGTGSRADVHIDPGSLYGHRLALIVGWRGVAPQDSLGPCAGGSASYPTCLNSHGDLEQQNPQRTAMDIEAVMRHLASDEMISLDGRSIRPSEHFAGIDFNSVNVIAQSFGGTVLAYLSSLIKGAEPSFRIHRLVADNVDSPTQAVITQGFEINRHRASLLKTACRANSACNASSFSNLDMGLERWLDAHHDTALSLVVTNPDRTQSTYDLYSAILFELWDRTWENGPKDGLDEAFFDALSAVLAASPGATTLPLDNSSGRFDRFVEELDDITTSTHGVFGIYAGDIANAQLDIASVPFQQFLTGIPSAEREDIKRQFANRIGLICSAYITSTNPFDSQVGYDTALAMPENSPWHYGFLIQYRSMLGLCPSFEAAGVIGRITAPAPPSANSDRLNIGSGLVYHGAMDVKHSAASAITVASYFTNTTVVTENLRGQGSGVNGRTPTDEIINQFYRDGDRTAAQTTVDGLNAKGLDPIFPAMP